MGDVKYILESIVLFIYDSLEEFAEGLSFAGSKRLRDAFYVTLGFLGFSVIMKLINLPTFISWQEALMAAGIMGVLLLIDILNQVGVRKIKERIFGRRGGEDDGED